MIETTTSIVINVAAPRQAAERRDAAPLLGATTKALLRALLAIVTIPLWITFGLVAGMFWVLLTRRA